MQSSKVIKKAKIKNRTNCKFLGYGKGKEGDLTFNFFYSRFQDSKFGCNFTYTPCGWVKYRFTDDSIS